jgi:hypothetical protein
MPLESAEVTLAKLLQNLSPERSKQATACLRLFQQVEAAARASGLEASVQAGPKLSVWYGQRGSADFLLSGGLDLAICHAQQGGGPGAPVEVPLAHPLRPSVPVQLRLEFNPISGEFEGRDEFGEMYPAKDVLAAAIAEKLRAVRRAPPQ